MTPLFKKLNFKNQSSIVSINSPDSFLLELEAMEGFATIHKTLGRIKEVEFAISFVTKQAEIEKFLAAIYPKLKRDAVVWICYPKMSSKKYECDFNRDTGWAAVAQYDLEPVRQVAIDEDWSSLRFRKVEFIKTITRRESFAITAQAKKRTTQKGI